MDLVVVGKRAHSLGFQRAPEIREEVLGVCDGVIRFAHPAGSAEAERLLQTHKGKVDRLGKEEILIPGLVDAHIHAPQFAFTGITPPDQLMEWLQKYTFPTEKRFRDLSFARATYEACVRALLSCGTTAAAFYATIHNEGSLLLAETCQRLGMRALVGKVSMDRNSPEDYVEASTAQAPTNAERFVEDVRRIQQGAPSPLVRPCLTPRFVPTCSQELLRGIGRLARRDNVFLQTHTSESEDEVRLSKDLEPDFACDTDLFESCGLLTPKSIHGHGNHLSDSDLTTLAMHACSIAHCPWSNFLFAGKPLPVKKCIDAGVKVALGSDLAAGVSPNMLVHARAAVMASRMFPKAQHLHWHHTFHLATAAGSEVLQINSGDFTVGREFDGFVASMRLPHLANMDFTNLERLEQFWNLGDDRNVRRVYVQGRLVLDKDGTSKL